MPFWVKWQNNVTFWTPTLSPLKFQDKNREGGGCQSCRWVASACTTELRYRNHADELRLHVRASRVLLPSFGVVKHRLSFVTGRLHLQLSTNSFEIVEVLINSKRYAWVPCKPCILTCNTEFRYRNHADELHLHVLPSSGIEIMQMSCICMCELRLLCYYRVPV